MSDLRSFQLTVAKVLTGLGIVHVPVLAAICVVLGRTWQPILLPAPRSGPLSRYACLTLDDRLRRLRSVLPLRWLARLAVGARICGHPWQVEMHFYYFAVLAMLSGFLRLARAGRWRPAWWPASLEPQLHFAGRHLSRRRQPVAGSVFIAVVVVIEVAMVDVHRPHDFGQAFATAAQAPATRRSGGRRAPTCRAASGRTTSSHQQTRWT